MHIPRLLDDLNKWLGPLSETTWHWPLFIWRRPAPTLPEPESSLDPDRMIGSFQPRRCQLYAKPSLITTFHNIYKLSTLLQRIPINSLQFLVVAPLQQVPVRCSDHKSHARIKVQCLCAVTEGSTLGVSIPGDGFMKEERAIHPNRPSAPWTPSTTG